MIYSMRMRLINEKGSTMTDFLDIIHCPNAYRLLVGKPEGERPLERLRSRWVDNILRWTLERFDEVMWNGLIWLRVGTGG
jgi:hypothetical protein